MKTLTVKELIEHLQEYPQNMEVFGYWEGQVEEICDIEPYNWGGNCYDKRQRDIILITVEYVNPEEAYMNKNKGAYINENTILESTHIPD